jgi:hypothetical protein
MNMQVEVPMIDFKGSHYPKDVILYAVFFYVRYAVSYRDLEEIMAERGVVVDHATLNRWVVKFSPLIACEAHRRKSATSNSWRMPSHAFTMRCQVGSVAIFSNGYKGAIAGHDYAASAANCWNADRPLVRNWRFLIMWATSMPSNVANAD